MKSKTLVISALAWFLAAAGAHAQTRYYLSQVANGRFDTGSFRTTFVLFNNTDGDVTATLELTGDKGSPLPMTIGGLGAGSKFIVPLSAGATYFLETDGEGALVVGAATVTVAAPIGVSAIFTIYDPVGNYVTEAGVGSSPPLGDFVIPVDTAGQSNTGLALFNIGDGSAVITMELRATNGRAVDRTTITLGNREHIARFLAGPDQLFPALGSFQGTLAVQSSVPIAALVLRQNQLPLCYTSLPVVPTSAVELTKNLPHVANGVFEDGSFRTSFLLFNLTSGTAQVTLSLTGEHGSPFVLNIPEFGSRSTFSFPLAGGASIFLQTDGQGPLADGAAVIASTAPIGAAAVFTVFNKQGVFQTEAGVGNSPALTALTIPVDISSTFETAVAFFNPGSAATRLTLKLLDGSGALSGPSATIDLEGKSHTASFFSRIFSLTSGFRGSATVVAPSGVAALTLRQNSTPLSYTTLPVASGFASGRPPVVSLLPTSRQGLTVTGDLTVDESLPTGYTLSGLAMGPGRVREVSARRDDGVTFPGEPDPATGRYTIALAEGTYVLNTCFQPDGESGLVVRASDPVSFRVSGDTLRNISLPAVPLFSASGTVSGLSNLPSTTDADVVFTSTDNTVEGRFPIGPGGGFQGSLPNGSYRIGIAVPLISYPPFQNQSLALYSIGTASVNNAPLVANVSIPATAKVSGTVRAGWLGSFAFGINVLARDRSAPVVTDAACVSPPSDSAASADATGQYQMFLMRDRGYDMSVTVPLRQGSKLLGVVGFSPQPGGLNLVGDTSYNLNVPDLPAQVAVTGRVTDSRGRGVSGVIIAARTVEVAGSPGIRYEAGAMTDANGNYSLVVLSGTGYQLLFVPPALIP